MSSADPCGARAMKKRSIATLDEAGRSACGLFGSWKADASMGRIASGKSGLDSLLHA